MNSLIDLASWFPNSRGFATQANAARKLAITIEGIEFDRSLCVTVQRPTDGRWLAIVILGSKDSWLACGLSSRGICVTN